MLGLCGVPWRRGWSMGRSRLVESRGWGEDVVSVLWGAAWAQCWVWLYAWTLSSKARFLYTLLEALTHLRNLMSILYMTSQRNLLSKKVWNGNVLKFSEWLPGFPCCWGLNGDLFHVAETYRQQNHAHKLEGLYSIFGSVPNHKEAWDIEVWLVDTSQRVCNMNNFGLFEANPSPFLRVASAGSSSWSLEWIRTSWGAIRLHRDVFVRTRKKTSAQHLIVVPTRVCGP